MTSERLSVLVATTNQGKLTELRALFADLPIEVLSLSEVLPNLPPIVEDGATFEENALIKARAGAEAAKMVTIADDSGLEVDALGGRPGVRSARFAREGATDAENNAALLAALEHVEDGHRQARFRCTIALVDPWSDHGGAVVTEGRCEGAIGLEARGTGGFGYDPLFIVEGLGRTLAELDEAEKNLVSHRGKASRAMHAALGALIAKRFDAARRIADDGPVAAPHDAPPRTRRSEP